MSKSAIECIAEEIKERGMDPSKVSRYVKTQLGRGLPFVSLKTVVNSETNVIVCIFHKYILILNTDWS